MDVIQQILDYVNKNVECELIIQMEAVAQQENSTARVLCIKLLGWLKGQARLNRPYALRKQANGWNKALVRVIENNDELNDLFECTLQGIEFRHSVDAEKVCGLVGSGYNPHMFRTQR